MNHPFSLFPFPHLHSLPLPLPHSYLLTLILSLPLPLIPSHRTENKQLYSWGSNSYGQLGAGVGAGDRNIPTTQHVHLLHPVRSLFATHILSADTAEREKLKESIKMLWQVGFCVICIFYLLYANYHRLLNAFLERKFQRYFLWSWRKNLLATLSHSTRSLSSTPSRHTKTTATATATETTSTRSWIILHSVVISLHWPLWLQHQHSLSLCLRAFKIGKSVWCQLPIDKLSRHFDCSIAWQDQYCF